MFDLVEKIALKFREATLLGGGKILPGFDSLRQHAAIPAGVTGDHCGAVFDRNFLDIDFDEIRVGDERLPIIAGDEVVQRDLVSTIFEAPANRDYGFIGRNVFLNFNYNLWRQQGKVFHQQHLVAAVDESAMSIAQDAQPDYVQGVNDGAGHAFDIGGNATIVFGALVEQQLVTQYLFIRGQNWLPGYVRNGLLAGSGLCLSAHDRTPLSAAWIRNFNPASGAGDSRSPVVGRAAF